MNAIVKLAIAAAAGALLGALLIGGMAGAVLLAVVAGAGTWGFQHGLGGWLREIPQRISEWRTMQADAAFADAQAAAGIVAPGPAPDPRPAAPPLPRPRRARPGGAGPGTPPAGAEGIPPRETDPGISGEQSDLMHAITSLVNRASQGDVIDVRRVGKVLSAAGDNLAGGASFLGTRLAEPDKHYGPEIFEPWVMAGAHFRAGALLLEQADAMTTSLLQSTVGELAASPRQAPHHSQLNGGTA
jgi:hypothetical protein